MLWKTWIGLSALGCLLAGCSSSDNASETREPESYPTCRYQNPFSEAEECRGYFGSGWTIGAIEENCSRPFSGVTGDAGVGTCPADGAIGTCTEDPDGELLLVTWFYGGDPQTTQSACEGFAGGVWSEDVSGPGGGGVPMAGELMQQAIDAMASNAEVSVSPPDCADGSCLDSLVEQKRAIVFAPAVGSPDTGFILYPGAGVDPRAYAPSAQAIAREGYLVAVVPMEDNFAFNGVQRADDVIDAEPDIDRWFLGGHSMGGVSAARYASQKGEALALDGLLLWASFPSELDDLSSSAVPVSSIFGSEDLLTTVQEIDATRELLPGSTRYVEIPGGNHAQFGFYGEQAGDGEALIDREAQQQMVVASTLHFMRSVRDGGEIHPGFSAATNLGADWCQESQRIVANVESTSLPNALIEVESFQATRAFGESKADVDASAAAPVYVPAQLRYTGNGEDLYAPPVIVGEVWCKLKSQEAIVAELGLPISGSPRPCADVNEAALQWALARVTSAERSRYEASGRSLVAASDNAFETGVEWLTGGELEVDRNGDTLEVVSPSLPVSLDANASEEFLGVYYCKLWSPAEALRFVLE